MGYSGSIYRDSQTIVVTKKSVQSRKRRSKTKQPKSYIVRYFREPDEEGNLKTTLKLAKDPNHPIFPRQWILSHGDLILGVYRSEPTEIWEELTKAFKATQAAKFKPISQRSQNLRQIMDQEEMKRMNFWERVAAHGRKKHSHPNLDIKDGEGFGSATVKGNTLHIKPKGS